MCRKRLYVRVPCKLCFRIRLIARASCRDGFYANRCHLLPIALASWCICHLWCIVISGGPFGPHSAMTSRLACALQDLFESATAKISKAARSGGGWKDPFKNAKDTVAEVCATLCVLMLCACTYVDDQYARKRATRCTMGEWAYVHARDIRENERFEMHVHARCVAQAYHGTHVGKEERGHAYWYGWKRKSILLLMEKQNHTIIDGKHTHTIVDGQVWSNAHSCQSTPG